MTIITGPRIITGGLLQLSYEEGVVFEIQNDEIAINNASPSLHHRVFHIHHIRNVDYGSHSYHHIYTHDESKIMVSTGPDRISSFKNTTNAEKHDHHSWWDIKHVGTSTTGRPTYEIKNKHTNRTLGDDGSKVEFWTISEYQSRVRRDEAQVNANNPPQPTYSQPVSTSNLCGNPTCGIDHICAADYNRVVRPMGYSGV